MTAIQESRLWNNLWRDLHNDSHQDESLAILNTSSHEIEVTDTLTRITKIIYPRTIFHTNRPLKNIIITQYHESLKGGRIGSVIQRSDIKKDMIAVETPLKFSNLAESYADFLSLNWVNHAMRNADRIVITPKSTYYIAVDDIIESSGNWLVVILLVVCIMSIIFIFV